VKKNISLSLLCGMFLLFAASGHAQNPKQTLEPGTFEAEVSGAVDLNWNGKAHAFKSPKGDWGIQLIKLQKGDDPVTSVLIMLPAELKPGIAKITAYEKAYDSSGKVTAVGAVFSSPTIVGINAEGTLNLSSAGSEFTGTFEFSVQSGFDKSQKYLVKGTFNKLKVE
jgi:hypothetical protein